MFSSFPLPRILPERSRAPRACSPPPPPPRSSKHWRPVSFSSYPRNPSAVRGSKVSRAAATVSPLLPPRVSRASGGTSCSPPSGPPLSAVLPRLSVAPPDGLSTFKACGSFRAAPPGGGDESVVSARCWSMTVWSAVHSVL